MLAAMRAPDGATAATLDEPKVTALAAELVASIDSQAFMTDPQVWAGRSILPTHAPAHTLPCACTHVHGRARAHTRTHAQARTFRVRDGESARGWSVCACAFPAYRRRYTALSHCRSCGTISVERCCASKGAQSMTRTKSSYRRAGAALHESSAWHEGEREGATVVWGTHAVSCFACRIFRARIRGIGWAWYSGA